MGEAVKEMAMNIGIHAALNSKWKMDHDIKADTRGLEGMLRRSASKIGLNLTDVQVQAICVAVYRPQSKLDIKYNIVLREKEALIHNRMRGNDIGAPVFVDLPKRAGKTIITLMSSTIFPYARSEQIKSFVDSRTTHSIGGAYYEYDDAPMGRKLSVVFVPKHLHQQWVDEEIRVKKIVDDIFGISVKIDINPKKRVPSDELTVAICNTSSHPPSTVLVKGGGYACLAFDESPENAGSKTNGVYCSANEGVSFTSKQK